MCETRNADRIIIPRNKAYEIILQGRDVFVRDCICRSMKKACPKDIWNVCILFENASENDLQDARPITTKEALSILETTSGKNAISNLFYTHDNHAITELCSCCTCCCRPLHRMKEEGNYSEELRSEYIASTDRSLCEGCGLCEESCFFEARQLENDSIQLVQEQCFGCGRCLEICPKGAISLERKNGRGVSLSMIM